MNFIKNLFFSFLLANVNNQSTIEYTNERKFLNSNLIIPNNLSIPLELNITDNIARFISIGDWGGLPVFPYRTLVQHNIARLMHKISKEKNVHFNLALGDNFYFKGVNTVDDPRFKKTFEDVFKNPEIPWFVLLGNHDHLGNAYAQIEYSKYSKRWIMPNYNYSVNVNINNGQSKLIYILIIDTILLCGNTGFDKSVNKKIIKIASHEERLDSINYFRNINETLKKISNEKYPYIIVAGHYPVWSIAEHGPTPCLVDNLRPLLHTYKVNAYFAGHEHDVEHLRDTYLNSTVDYIISGATNIVYNSTEHIKDIPKDSLKFYWSDWFQINGALTLVEADLNYMNISYIKTNGENMYKISIKNKYKNNF